MWRWVFRSILSESEEKDVKELEDLIDKQTKITHAPLAQSRPYSKDFSYEAFANGGEASNDGASSSERGGGRKRGFAEIGVKVEKGKDEDLIPLSKLQTEIKSGCYHCDACGR